MKYIVGLDGGGTKTNCVFADETGNSLFEISGGSSNFLSIGTDKSTSTIYSLIKSGLTNLDSSFEDIEIILAGISGAGRKFHADSLKEVLFKKLPENFTKLFIESDARIALEGALGGEPGAILIAGTGSVIFAKNSEEKIYRAGGFGRLIGDEGSGHSIGIKTLNVISKMIDGRERKGELLEKFQTIFQVNNEDDLISLVHNPGFDAASIALFTIKSAGEGVEEAGEILNEESDELFNLVLTIQKKMNLSLLKIVFIGSLIETENYYSHLIKEKIKKLSDIVISDKKHSPEMGAVILAKKILSGLSPADS
jgi:N-acetylglucosamine kinase-like BadF-type ATPase